MAAPGRLFLASEARRFEFGDFRLEPATRQLLRNGAPVPLAPRTFDLLEMLVANRHRVLEKDELLRRVWSDAIVEESNLTQQVFVLRKALGDTQDTPRFIATIPRHGYRFVGEVREASLASVDPQRPPAAIPGAASMRRGPTLIVLAVVAAILVAGSVMLTRSLRRSSRSAPPTFRPLTFAHRGLDRARFTPDGRSVVLNAQWQGDGYHMFITPTSDSELRPVGVTGAKVVRVSSSGDVAVLLDEGGSSDGLTLAKVPLGGGGPRKLIEGVQNADWAPEIDQFAVLRRAAGRTRLEYPAGTPLYETSAWIEAVKISPGRDAVAFLEHPVMNDTRGFAAVVDRQGHRRVLSREWGAVFGLAWTPGGNEVWFGKFDGRIYAIGAADLGGHQRDVYGGPAGLIVQDIAQDGLALATQFSFHVGVRWRPLGSTEERSLTMFDLTRACAIGADGKTILFTVEDQGPEWTTYATYVQAAGGPGPIRLGEGNAQGLSPDGRWALAIAHRNPPHLMLLPTGAEKPRELPPGPIEQLHKAQWLPDGQRVVLAGNEKHGGIRLYVQSVSGGAPTAITPEGYSLDPDGVSPDGRSVVCLPEQGPPSLCSVDEESIKPLSGVERGEKAVRWSEDGRVVYVYRGNRFPLQLYAVEARTGRRRIWKEIAPPDPGTLRNVRQLLVTPDGSAYAYNYVRVTNDLFLVEGLK